MTLDDASTVGVRFLFKPESVAQDRIIAATGDALRRFGAWFGPPPVDALTVIDVPWRATSDTAFIPATIVVTSRWVSSEWDVALERELMRGIAQQYWTAVASGDAGQAWFRDGLVRYSLARVANEALEGRHRQTYRFFGEFVPYTVRSLSLSRSRRDPRPLIRRFPAASGEYGTAWQPARDPADRTAESLHTLERYIGWPAMQQALSTLVRRHRGGGATAAEFVALVSDQRGIDEGWVLEMARGGGSVDYALERSDTRPLGTSSFETALHVRRNGRAPFAVSLVTEFADRTTAREWVEASEGDFESTYLSQAPAVAVSIDPDALFLLDADRTNNSVVMSPRFSRAAARLTLHWMVWLQDLVLICTSLT